MIPEDDELIEGELAVGGTRPALMPYVGIPWTAFAVFCMTVILAAVVRWHLVIPIVVAFLYLIRLYRKDYNAGRCLMCWVETTGRHMAAHQLGGSFISPRPSRAFRGML